jgi:hypothetical protein
MAAVGTAIAMVFFVPLPAGQTSGQRWIPDTGASLQIVADRAWTGPVKFAFEIRVTGHVLTPLLL